MDENVRQVTGVNDGMASGSFLPLWMGVEGEGDGEKGEKVKGERALLNVGEKRMTVKQLRRALRKADPNAIVVVQMEWGETEREAWRVMERTKLHEVYIS